MNHIMQNLLLDYAYQDAKYTYKKTEEKIKISQELNTILYEIYLLLHHNIVYSKYSVQPILQIIFTKIQWSFQCYIELLQEHFLDFQNNHTSVNMEKIIYNIYELFLFYFLLLPPTKNEIYAQSIQFCSYFLRYAFLCTNSKFYQDQLMNIYQ